MHENEYIQKIQIYSSTVHVAGTRYSEYVGPTVVTDTLVPGTTR